MRFRDSFSLAARTIKSNKLRAYITIAIIAFGIMALIGIITAIQAMEQKFAESFSSMGANGFSIRFKEPRNFMAPRTSTEVTRTGRKERRSSEGKPITLEQAESFKKNYPFPALVSISLDGRGNATVTGNGKKTNPTVRISGGDENYVSLNGYEITVGRGLNERDVESGQNVCVIGADVAKTIFGGVTPSGLDKTIIVNSIPYRVIGILDPKGATFGFSRDNLIITSYNNVRRHFNSGNSFIIGVKVANINIVDPAIGEAIATFRSIRKLDVTEGDNFYVEKSDSFAEMAMTSIKYLTISATIIGMITLIGAAIGLMNIMLVSVTERTKEIGLIKAIGGKEEAIRTQFLLESLIISLLGAVIGIILGVLIGNFFSLILGSGFVIPWLWVLYGVGICTLVGLLAGLYPAVKASQLNPIEALRYE